MDLPRVGDVAGAVLDAFPAQWAEPWDNVGLILGDATAEVTGVTVSLDPTAEVVRRSAEAGRNVVVTHHPAFFDAPAPLAVVGASGIGALALSLGVSLIAAHTNLDRAPAGGDSLCAALGLRPARPLERSLQPMALVTVFVPSAHADAVIDAMTAAGGGRIGEYSGCAFSAAGEGRFRPPSGSRPFLGKVGEASSAEELRVEMVCPPDSAAAVAAAALGAHPYEEPLVLTSETAIARGAARLGRLCPLPEGCTLGRLAALVAERLHVTPRVWGDAEAVIAAAATATGSGRSLIGDAIAAGAGVLVTGEVRYHDATDALERGLAIIEAGHDATEWPLVPVLASAVRSTPGLVEESVVVDEPTVRWWTPREQ